MIPAGGLANRMRAIASGYHLAKQIGSRLEVIWFMDWGMKAHFNDIFTPINEEGVALREATLMDRLINDRPRPKNHFLFKIPQRLIYDRCLYEHEITELRNNNYDFTSWARGKDCYMGNFQEFGGFDNALYSKLFHPTKEVTDKIQQYTSQFSDYTIGMHIRRTDSVRSINQSPTELFIEYGKKEMTVHPDARIFLATDSEDVKEEMRIAFGGRIITSAAEATRGSLEGIRDGMAELWALSYTDIIYGSFGSSYSEMAAKLKDDMSILKIVNSNHEH